MEHIRELSQKLLDELDIHWANKSLFEKNRASFCGANYLDDLRLQLGYLSSFLDAGEAFFPPFTSGF